MKINKKDVLIKEPILPCDDIKIRVVFWLGMGIQVGNKYVPQQDRPQTPVIITRNNELIGKGYICYENEDALSNSMFRCTFDATFKPKEIIMPNILLTG
jgi:hypothetical protein